MGNGGARRYGYFPGDKIGRGIVAKKKVHTEFFPPHFKTENVSPEENNICAAAICGKTIKNLRISCGDKRPLVPPEVINCLSFSFFLTAGRRRSAKKCFPKLG